MKKLTFEQAKNIKEGQKIVIKYNGDIYTKKVIHVVTQSFNDMLKFNVNKIGSGTGFTGIDWQDVISVK